MLRQLGASAIVSGGQTMNPPVEEFIAAIHSGDAERYIILPNNKNIVLAAKQVKKLLGDRVEVVPTVDVQQGLAALLAFQPEASLEDNVGWMEARRQEVVSGSVTKAVRDSVVDGQPVKAGHFLGIKAGKVAAQGECIAKVLLTLLQQLVSESAEVATLYYGSELTVSEAEKLAAQMRDAFPELTVELYDGGQPLYPLLVSVE
jgi:dihydroxyacetone kinase-like predicted kinase